jgi:hypothetical protein
VTEDVQAAGGVLDHEEDVEPVPGDRLDVEQVAGEDAALALGGTGSRTVGPPW